MIWISIEERSPPETSVTYLCTDGEDITLMVYYGEFGGVHDWSSYSCNTIDVTHWMPLPELP